MRVLFLCLLVAACSCGQAAAEASPDPSDSAGTSCPAVPTLTYENFARPFMQAYCVRCHSKDAPSPNIYGAPSDHHFDTKDQIRNWAQHIFLFAAGTSARINRTMPLDPPLPTDEERQKLGQWLICGAP